MKNNYKPIVLIILDGWGLSPSWGGNAIAMNNPPFITSYWREYPHKILQAHSHKAKDFQIIGDSRLGHSTIAAGRFIKQDIEIISDSIKNGSFYHNKILKAAITHAKKNNSNLHLLGMISQGGIHSHLSHLFALLELCHREQFSRVYIDAISDGIDSEPMQALEFIFKIQNKMDQLGLGEFSSVMGRSFGMDRSSKWNKTRSAYELLIDGKGARYKKIEQAITSAYKEEIADQNIKPSLIKTKNGFLTIKNNDSIIFFNFRPDRARKIHKIFTDINFKRFLWKPTRLSNINYTTLTRIKKNQFTPMAYVRYPIKESLGEILAKYHKKQLRLAESEKRAHVTYFFNCGNFDRFYGEEDLIVASPSGDYEFKPEMSAQKITNLALKSIKSQKYDFILINYANVDLLAHTGNIRAAGEAVKVVDNNLKQVVEETLKNNGLVIVTADHGNVEEMVRINPNRPVSSETQHSFNPVPFILIAKDLKKDLIRGALSVPALNLSRIIGAEDDLTSVAPTILEIMNLPKPEIMTGHSLIGKLD